jgi:hypothetical protein
MLCGRRVETTTISSSMPSIALYRPFHTQVYPYTHVMDRPLVLVIFYHVTNTL